METTIMENQMEKKMENDIETGIIMGYILIWKPFANDCRIVIDPDAWAPVRISVDVFCFSAGGPIQQASLRVMHSFDEVTRGPSAEES